MLSALLNSIQGSLGSSGFLVASVFPILIFTMLNGYLASRAWPRFAAWLATFEGLTDKTMLFAAVLAGILVAAYILSSLSSAIQELCEGRRRPVSWFRPVLHRVQLARLRRLRAAYLASFRGFDEVAEGLRDDGPRKTTSRSPRS